MKIRIKGNSARVRVTKPEVSQFCKDGYIEEKTSFGATTLTYALSSKNGVDELSADFQQNKITLYVPVAMAKNWDTNSKVGFSGEVVLENGNTLSLLLEKDFTCLEDRGEDESDNYPNPKLMEK